MHASQDYSPGLLMTCTRVERCKGLIQRFALSSAPALLSYFKSQPGMAAQMQLHTSIWAVSTRQYLVTESSSCSQINISMLHMCELTNTSWVAHNCMPCSESELQEQRRLMGAVRGILTSSVQSSLGPDQQAFLQNPSSWEPPPPSTGTT